MKLILPKEHGAWAMWIAPYLIGITIAGFKWIHLVLFISLFFGYISISPFLQGFRRPKERKTLLKYTVSYLLIALLFGFPFLFFYSGLFLIFIFIMPFFMINIYYVVTKNERALFNDFVAMVGLTSTFLASYYIAVGRLDSQAFLLWFLNVLFFFGSALYVKSIYREKTNGTFKLFAKVYMILLPLLSLLIGNYLLMIAFLFSTVRGLLTSNSQLQPKTVGVVEIINSLWFILFIALSFKI